MTDERSRRDQTAIRERDAADRRLKKDLGFQQLFFISFGSIIGSGWLFATLAANATAGPAAIFAWIITAVLIIFIALNWAEVASMIPRSGGVVRYPHLTHGGYLGFIMGWAFLLGAVTTPPIEALAVVQYLSTYIENATGVSLTTVAQGTTILTGPGILVSIVLMVFFFAVNIFGVRFFGIFNQYVTWWKLAIPVLTFLLLFFTFNGSNFTSYGGFTPMGSGAAVLNAINVAGIVFSFQGFRMGLNYGGEVRNPQRDVLAATVLSAVAAAVVYLLLQIAFTGALDWQSAGVEPGDWGALTGSNWADQPLYSALESSGIALLGAFGVLLLIDAAVSPAGTGWIYMGESSRTLYGMGMTGDLPRALQRVDDRFRVPWVALVASLVVGCFFFLPFPSWYKLLGFTTSTVVFTFVMGAVQLQVMRRTAPDLPRPFYLRGAAVLSPLGFLAGSMIFYWAGFSVLEGVVPAILVALPLYAFFQATRRGLLSLPTGLALGVPFLAILIATQYFGPLVRDSLPFPLFWALTAGEVLAFTGLVWLMSGPVGRREINSAWWILFMTLALYLLSYYGAYGEEVLVPFPYDSLIAVVIGLVSYYWGVASGYQTEEMRQIAASGSGLVSEEEEADLGVAGA